MIASIFYYLLLLVVGVVVGGNVRCVYRYPDKLWPWLWTGLVIAVFVSSAIQYGAALA